MGSRLSSSDNTDAPSSTKQSENGLSCVDQVTTNNQQKPSAMTKSDRPTSSDVYIKDQFRLEFLDCTCCCDTTKKVPGCDFQGSHILHDLYEMVVSPEYKLNCRCSCGDDYGNAKQSLKFGLTGSPNIHVACNDPSPYPTTSH